MILIDGKRIAKEIRQQLKSDIQDMQIKPHLVVILVGDDPASQVYVRMKERDAKEIGMISTVIRKSADISQKELKELIMSLNEDNTVHGILLQLPIPQHLNPNEMIDLIHPNKDVDGLHDVNVGRLHNGKRGLTPCTPTGCMELLKRYNITISGKRAVVIGRSNLVGRPIARMLEQENATVTICHSKTQNLGEITRMADILVVAIGRPKQITKEMVKKGAVIIDVGINRDENGKLVGDVDFENVKEMCEYITPVPGGVGPMTRAMLLVNTKNAAS